MNKKIKKINANELVVDMVLAKEVKINGVMLLEKEAALNNKYINSINKIDPFLEVVVYDNDDDVDYFIENSIKKLNKKEKVFEEIASKLNEVYKESEYNSKISITKLRKLQNDMLQQSNDYGITMRSIVNDRDKNEYLYRHCINVGVLSYMIGKWIKIKPEELNCLTYAGLLHDIGKTRIDKNILNKKSRLTSQEFNIVKTHATIGYDIVKNMPYMDKSVPMGVLMHHERCDGSGYPLKLKEDKIHMFGKIIAIADVFDAMTSNRPYRRKMSPFKVLEEMKEQSFAKLDYNYFTIFLKGMINCYIGEMVRLSNGKSGKIISMDINNISKPLILVGADFIDLKCEKELFIEDLI